MWYVATVRKCRGACPVGSISTWIPSAGVAYHLPVSNRHTTIEAAFAHVGQNRNPSNRAPAFTFVGLFLRHSLRAATAKGVQPFLALGIGRLRVGAEQLLCEPPTCFREGGSHFLDGTFTTVVGGTGLLVPFAEWGALRGDVRLYLPRNAGADAGDSDDPRPELAAGLVLWW